MAVEWPADVNQTARRRTVDVQPELDIDEFQVEAGPPITGRNSTADSDLMSWETNWTDYELARMQAFIREDLAGGTLPVIRLNPVTGMSEEFTFVPKNPYRLRDHTVNKWRVVLNMRRMP